MKELCKSEKSKENLQLLQNYATLHIVYPINLEMLVL